ncbi:plastocyanin/azurin family copper-binding protein [Halanaerobium sp. ST460_2HS_T2]|uniref:plastocyanin/azurin family copper-binding protein n=1 Tax=Halanaerobium sp. ST460_2HS_T2 TaxID=2183914 RepID=UPI000E0606FC|nr:plastocyanin/azurin family copper-binding protein [Halanaerobium sp. ST460_2HS_T2]RCW52106.1 plastocyanin [Halanaerobium sp. ST460_2HS_T2]
MRSTKKTVHLNLRLFFLLIIGMIFILSGSVYAEEDMTAEENIKFIKVDTLNFVFDPEIIRLNPGEKVKFIVSNPSSAFHTFTIYHSKSERKNPLVNISLSSGDEKTETLTMPDQDKILYLVCLPHEGIGMVGQVIVGNPEVEEES